MSKACRFTEYVKGFNGYQLHIQKDGQMEEGVIQNILASKPYHEAQGGKMQLKYKRKQLQQITCVSYDKQVIRVYSFI